MLKLKTTFAFTLLTLSAIASAAPSGRPQASGNRPQVKGQCISMLVDSALLATYSQTCRPAAGLAQQLKAAENNADWLMQRADCGNLISAEDAEQAIVAQLNRIGGDKTDAQFCAAVQPEIQRSLQRYGSK